MNYSIFHIDGGIGKNIAATNIVRSIKNAFPERELIVVSPFPEVFLNNPNIYRVYKTGMSPYFYDDFVKNKNSKIFKHEPYSSEGVINRAQNLSEAWAESLSIELDQNKPEIFFNDIEMTNVQFLYNKVFQGKPIIALQTNGGIGVEKANQANFNWYRDLPPQLAQKLVKEFGHKYTFIQIKYPNQVQIAGAIPVDSLSLREVLLLLSKCDGAVCIDSFVQHAMAAFEKESLVFWIGNSPKVFGYDLHKNIVTKLKFEEQNIEGYLEPYPLLTQGYQCPKNYNVEKVFSYKEIKDNFIELYGNLK